MKRFVWDTSALLNLKEPDQSGYSPAYSLMKDLSDGRIPGPYQNIFPALSAFELDASVSRKHREGSKILRDFYIIDENALVYPIDQQLIYRCHPLVTRPGFDSLQGADLVFACIAYLEQAYLVTLDSQFTCVAADVRVIDLNLSRHSPEYLREFRVELHAP